MVVKTGDKAPGVLTLLVCLCLSAGAQKGEWTWMGGSSAAGSLHGQSGVYGTLGTPAAQNAPGSRDTAANWTDSNGHLWLFGGWGYDVNGNSGYLNDLWEFDPSTSEWAWMSGSSTVGGHGGQPGVYGTLGTPAAGNTPGSRNGAANWTDRGGNLWLFGGWNYDTNSIAGELNDLWEFNPSTNQWAWMSGSSTEGPLDGQSGVYGTFGVPAAGNTPGGLYAPSCWTDSSGNLWLFGGQGYDANGDFNELDGLWVFYPSTSEWAWMGGSSTIPSNGDQPGIYGTLGTAANGNTPGNRSDALAWTDGGGNLWLFGGEGYDALVDDFASFGWLSDFWEFNPSISEWAWMGGSGISYSNSGVYGALGTLAADNFPGSRESASTWTDSSGNLWLFAGNGIDAGGNWGYLNDLWEFNPSTGEWAWMSGSTLIACSQGSSPDSCGVPGVYGTLGTAAPGNVPGARYEAASWTDSNGNLWLFGGDGFDASGTYGYLNDLWRYQPSSAVTPAAATPTFSPAAGNYLAAQTVDLSDATPLATIYYTTNGTAPTTSSTPYTGSITVSSTETLEAMATASGYSQSLVASAVYTITPPVATPIFSPPGGSYLAAQTVDLSDATPLATIYYTTNGTAPTTSSTQYTGSITVSSTETLEAIATASGYSQSLVASAVYTILPPPPAFTIAGTEVTVAPGATIGNTSTITVTPVSGFTGSVALTAAITSSPAGAQDQPALSFGNTTPVDITGSANGTATLTITTTGATTCALDYPKNPGAPWYVGGSATLACLMLVGVPSRRRSWRTMLGMLALLAALAGGVLACGGHGGSSNPGTTVGYYMITVTGASGSTTATGTVTLTVQ